MAEPSLKEQLGLSDDGSTSTEESVKWKWFHPISESGYYDSLSKNEREAYVTLIKQWKKDGVVNMTIPIIAPASGSAMNPTWQDSRIMLEKARIAWAQLSLAIHTKGKLAMPEELCLLKEIMANPNDTFRTEWFYSDVDSVYAILQYVVKKCREQTKDRTGPTAPTEVYWRTVLLAEAAEAAHIAEHKLGRETPTSQPPTAVPHKPLPIPEPNPRTDDEYIEWRTNEFKAAKKDPEQFQALWRNSSVFDRLCSYRCTALQALARRHSLSASHRKRAILIRLVAPHVTAEEVIPM